MTLSIGLLWYILGALFTALPVPCVVQYIKYGNVFWIILAIIMNVLLVYTYYLLFKDRDTGVAFSIMKVIAIIIVVLIGIFAYGEKVSIWIIFGLILGSVSLLLL